MNSSSLKIVEMKRIANTRGGRCLSNEYLNAKSKLTWECEKGHKWEATPDKVKRGSWCPVCAGNINLDIDRIKAIAKERGGKCLSDNYINSSQKLLWVCSENHQWEATARHIIHRGQWCPICSSGISERISRIAFEQIFVSVLRFHMQTCYAASPPTYHVVNSVSWKVISPQPNCSILSATL